MIEVVIAFGLMMCFFAFCMWLRFSFEYKIQRLNEIINQLEKEKEGVHHHNET